MENYTLIAKESEPSISLNYKENRLEFSGTSYTEDVRKTYSDVFQWINEFKYYLKEEVKVKKENKSIICDFKFEYINSATVFVIRDIIKNLLEIRDNIGVDVEFNWYHWEEDEDMLDISEELEELFEVTFNYHIVTS